LSLLEGQDQPIHSQRQKNFTAPDILIVGIPGLEGRDSAAHCLYKLSWIIDGLKHYADNTQNTTDPRFRRVNRLYSGISAKAYRQDRTVEAQVIDVIKKKIYGEECICVRHEIAYESKTKTEDKVAIIDSMKNCKFCKEA